MKSITALAAGAAAALVLAAPAAASPQVTLTADAPKATWKGPTATGFNTSFFLDGLATTGTCANTDDASRCDSTIVAIDAKKLGPGSKLAVRMDGFRPVDDFDLRVYDLGTKPTSAGNYLGSPTSTDVSESSPLGTNDPRFTFAGDFENKEVAPLKTGLRYFRVEVVYFAVAAGSYNGTVTATGLLPADE